MGHRIAERGQAAAAFAARFVRASRGNVAMIFALTMPVLLLITVGGVDIHRASTVRVNLQDALDAATLAAARSQYTEDEDLTQVGLSALRANLQAYPDITLRDDLTTFILNDDSVVIADAKVDVKTLVANIFLPPYGQFFDDNLPVGAHSEVNRSSKNIEVALVLDITGSMSGQRIVDLKAAAVDLVDIVVQPTQSPYTTRMSVVPYSIGVNVGSWANAARGSPTGSTSISGASWSTGSSKSISHISRASPGVVTTSSNHGLQDNDYVWIDDVDGMEEVNDRAYRVQRISNTRFSLQRWTGSSWSAVNTSGYDSYDDDGDVRECRVSDCSVVVTSNNHGMDDGEGVYITGVGGMSQINNKPYQIANVTNHTYSIGVNGADWGTYSSGGASWCGRDGCQWRVFRNTSANLRAHQIGPCVTERIGAQAYTDASPTGAKVGRNYPSTANPCPAATLQPLSSNKTALKSLINSFVVTGSTAGHIGMAWGWYTVSPNFNSLWAGGQANAYDPKETVKSVIIMTDGEFNTPYCTGVIAQNAGSGSGSNNDKINCNGTNGDPFDQGEALCDAMKAEGIIVYTVGFQIAPNGEAADLLKECATSSKHAYLPSSGDDLSDAFASIGRDITSLRISK